MVDGGREGTLCLGRQRIGANMCPVILQTGREGQGIAAASVHRHTDSHTHKVDLFGIQMIKTKSRI